ncbi:hypothetical protein CANINC_000415, partial [Pichia inconspicua]
NIHLNTVLGLRISNVSFNEYENTGVLKNHMDILWENCKLRRLDFDFTQCHLLDVLILDRIIEILAHIQKHHNYNVYVSVSLPINKNLVLDDQYLDILSRFKKELVNICMVNVLIPKELKRKSMSWPEMVKQVFQNLTQQIREIDSDGSMFVGKLNKYLGVIFDCDVSSIDGSTLTSAVRKSVIHGERKNMSHMDFLNIWEWCRRNEIGHLQLKWYLSNSKNLDQVMRQYRNVLINNENLPLPQELLEITSAEMTIDAQLPEYENEQQNELELTRLPSYRTVCS